MKFYNHKQKRELENKIRSAWGATIKFEEVMEGGKGKLWWVSSDVQRVTLRRVRVESLGNYFGRIDKHGKLRLSVEGAMKVGPSAKENVVELTDKELEEWLRGINLSKQTGKTGYVILKHGKDFVGCGKAYSKGTLNHVPKERRIKNL
jgi:NOL1/NOP2/fmu family ribosome biogenesis protein